MTVDNRPVRFIGLDLETTGLAVVAVSLAVMVGMAFQAGKAIPILAIGLTFALVVASSMKWILPDPDSRDPFGSNTQ